MRSVKELVEWFQENGHVARAAHDGIGGQVLKNPFKTPYFVVVSWGDGWEHASISIRNSPRTPSWEEMCWLKNQIWGEDETVVQIHPKKSDYVNVHKSCLHLWRPVDKELPTPPVGMV